MSEEISNHTYARWRAADQLQTLSEETYARVRAMLRIDDAAGDDGTGARTVACDCYRCEAKRSIVPSLQRHAADVSRLAREKMGIGDLCEYQIEAQVRGYANKLLFVFAVSFEHARDLAREHFEGPWVFRIMRVDDELETHTDQGFDPEWEET